MPIPELRTLLHRFRRGSAAAARGLGRDGVERAGAGRSGAGRSGAERSGFGRSGGRGRGQRRGVLATGGRGVGAARPRIRGSALVQALIAGLIAVIGALLLASRLFSSRVSSFSRSDNLAAREAAEFGINELQAQLNTNQRGYLWVTRRDNWSAAGLLTSLNACNVTVQDASGNPATSLPALPEGVSSAKTISNVGGTTISYQLSAFEPPSLPDNGTTTTAQAAFCSNATAAANFGNLRGGSALITVQGTVTRGGRSSSFRMTRRSHVASTTEQPAFSFMILGDAYKDNATGEVFGVSSDVATLNYLDGNICYGQLKDTTCFTTSPLPKTIIGCRDLGSCQINNVFNNNLKDKLSKLCQDVKPKKKKKAGFTCNDFQQAPVLPAAPTPFFLGFTGYASSSWAALAGVMDCEIAENKANDFGKCESTRAGSKQSRKDSYFPYYNRSSFPASLSVARSLKNSDLVRGCYFNNTGGGDSELGTSSTAINCLVGDLVISKKGLIR